MAKGRMNGLGRTVQPKPGSQQTFWVRVPSDTQGHPFQYAQRTATLERTGRHCYLYVGEGLSLDSLTLDDWQSTYDSIIYPTCLKSFGHEWNPGIDGDSLVTLLVIPGLARPYYFSNFDEVPDSQAQQYGHRSNEREMFYLGLDQAPDPGYSRRIKALMAHCQEHLIVWYQNPPCDIWMNEACAMYAMDLCGFGDQISGELEAFRTSLNIYTVALESWPSGIVDFPNTLSDSIDVLRGRGYAFLAYMIDKYPGPDPHNPLINHIVARRDNRHSFIGSGIGNLEMSWREIGYWPPIYVRDLLPSWAVANFVNDTTIGGPPKFLGYRKALGGQAHFVVDPSYGPNTPFPGHKWFLDLPESLQLSLPLYGQACVQVPTGKENRRVEFAQDSAIYFVEGVMYSTFLYAVNGITSTTDDFAPGTNTLTTIPPNWTFQMRPDSTIKGIKIVLSVPSIPGRLTIPACYVYAYTPLSSAETSAVNRAVYVFPNPFNPDRDQLHFRYVVTAPCKVDIRIYDASGNQLAVLADEEWQSTPATYTSRTWDGRTYRGIPVANGVYFGRVRIGNKTTGVKIAVMR